MSPDLKNTECHEELPEEDKENVPSEKMTAEEIIDSTIGRDSKLKFWVLFFFGVVVKWAGPILVYIPIFTGFVPYTKWTCISDKCLGLLSNTTAHEDFYSRTTICGNNLLPRVDFQWRENRTTYAMDWDLICSDESKGSLLKSVFFAGAFLGLLLGTVLFERIGRKVTVLMGITVCGVSTFANAFITDYNTMLSFRVLQGLGAFMAQTGCSLLAIEFTPSFRRNLGQLGHSLMWTAGTIIIIGVSYVISSWHHVYLASGIIILVCTVPILVYPESPRYQLIQGKEGRARVTFQKLTTLFNSPLDLSSVSISYTNYKQSYLSQLKDFTRYPTMLYTTIILMIGWLIISAISYGLMYSWGQLGADLYTSMLLATVGSFIAKGSGYTYIMIHKLGRKWATVVNFCLVAVFFLLSMIDVKLGEVWTFRQVMCMCAIPFISAIWSCIHLLSSELAPTSHRGMIMGVCSAAARVGAFGGPYLSLLYTMLDVRVVLSLFGGSAVFGAVVLVFCLDSTGKPIPSIPEEMGGKKYEKLGSDE